jgi:nucleotide-binding universal stress UspA family protein
MSIVLAAIDSSAAARPVLVAASALGRVLGARVEAVYVADEESQTARACADAAGVPYTRIPGDPVPEICARAARDDVVAVAIGARRRLNRRHIGERARAVATAVDKPVLVVPPEADPAERIRTVVVAMEGTPGKARAVKHAVELAAAAELELVVVHVDDETSIPSFSDQAAHETETYSREFLAQYVRGAPGARFEPRVGVPADEIVATCETVGADLLAVGWPPAPDEHHGIVAQEVLDRSHVPVLLVALAA